MENLYYPRELHSEIEARLQRLTSRRRQGRRYRRAVRSGDADGSTGARH